jgi:hypothetical protein
MNRAPFTSWGWIGARTDNSPLLAIIAEGIGSLQERHGQSIGLKLEAIVISRLRNSSQTARQPLETLKPPEPLDGDQAPLPPDLQGLRDPTSWHQVDNEPTWARLGPV